MRLAPFIEVPVSIPVIVGCRCWTCVDGAVIVVVVVVEPVAPRFQKKSRQCFCHVIRQHDTRMRFPTDSPDYLSQLIDVLHLYLHRSASSLLEKRLKHRKKVGQMPIRMHPSTQYKFGRLANLSHGQPHSFNLYTPAVHVSSMLIPWCFHPLFSSIFHSS